VGLSQLAASALNRSSGGAGGNGAVVGGEGGRGGGGGGAIEIAAGGDLEVGSISARGVDGDNGTLIGAQKGGGGSGGVVLLRAGRDLKAGDLDVGGGGAGQKGRARYDAGGAAVVSSGELGAGHYRGPMFVDAPLTTRVKAPELTVAGKPLAEYRYFTIDAAGTASQLVDEMIGADGTAQITLRQALTPGSSQICLVVAGGDGTSDTRNCIYIAYVR
jgi:hypothetical protein